MEKKNLKCTFQERITIMILTGRNFYKLGETFFSSVIFKVYCSFILFAENNNKKETVKYSWPMSTIDRILMKRSSSLQRRKANYSYGLQANCSNNISHSKNQTCGQNTNVRTTVIEVPCLCDETK